jgi:hypothetical protein
MVQKPLSDSPKTAFFGNIAQSGILFREYLLSEISSALRCHPLRTSGMHISSRDTL